MSVRVCLALVVLVSPAGAQQEARPLRPVATYSIVARDSVTGEMGVAVQSHWFSVGALVSWAEAGVGAVATQSFVDPRYGPLGIRAHAARPLRPGGIAGARRQRRRFRR